MAEDMRAHVIISGRVQGVFFRAETRRAAEGHGVFGWVRNKGDGTVEAVFEGDKGAVNATTEWCHKGSPHSKVTNVDVRWEDYSGKFRDFEIRY